MSARRRTRKFRPRWLRNVLIVAASIGAIVLAVMLVGPGFVPGAISARLHDKHALDGSTVESGNITDFLGAVYVEKVRLTEHSAVSLASSMHVFEGCGSTRVCEPSTGWGSSADTDWSLFPKDSVCVDSRTSGDLEGLDGETICLDERSRTLYYYRYSHGY